jgi:hypothetical protein
LLLLTTVIARAARSAIVIKFNRPKRTTFYDSAMSTYDTLESSSRFVAR